MQTSASILALLQLQLLSFISSRIANKLQGKNKRPTKPGTVLLHQFAPFELAVSDSPPCIKLEAFLRMSKIPYENDYNVKFSKKVKMPWIEFNGQEIADSNFCGIQFLKIEFQVDIDCHLSATEKAIAHSVRTMLEEKHLLFVVIYFLAKKSQGKNSKRPTKKRGIVLLHQFAPFELAVSGSPPCTKLETFLRMSKIPYENDYNVKFSKKGKMPWIEFNGQEIADSNFCIQFLKSEFQVDIDCHLSATEKAIAHSVHTMLEENTYWAMMYYRFSSEFAIKYMPGFLFGNRVLPLRYLLFYMVRREVMSQLWSYEISRHPAQDLYEIAQRDLIAVSAILGQKKFLFGEKPCVADAALFAFITTSTWDCPESPFAELTKSKAQNLEKHAQRMKEMFYPDWDEIISKKTKSD
ncbi:hypothetical protein OS493_036390 [Desmophyllum pertusum]|uniref:Failed axon connections-like protein n=1 Tax=Desmophyllum pertusum TaxID=174260 RepID=A0A9W9ZZ55_9CNID|nr:hypothetical protein OS493_036390 [Desmophyllum pertusum]